MEFNVDERTSFKLTPLNYLAGRSSFENKKDNLFKKADVINKSQWQFKKIKHLEYDVSIREYHQSKKDREYTIKSSVMLNQITMDLSPLASMINKFQSGIIFN